jgi:thiamine-phosphate pyrophosphorylase
LLLYYITDRKQFSGGDAEQRRHLLACISAAASAGVDWIQLREKDLTTRELEHLAIAARRTIADCPTKLLVNHRADVALACGLDGVHLTSSSTELVPSDARAIFTKAGVLHPLIAISCHSQSELALADSHGADLAVYGPVFGKGQLAGAGLRAVTALKGRIRMKVLAIGGVTRENVNQCLEAGADGIAGIRLFQDHARDMTRFVSSLRSVRSAQA